MRGGGIDKNNTITLHNSDCPPLFCPFFFTSYSSSYLVPYWHNHSDFLPVKISPVRFYVVCTQQHKITDQFEQFSNLGISEVESCEPSLRLSLEASTYSKMKSVLSALSPTGSPGLVMEQICPSILLTYLPLSISQQSLDLLTASAPGSFYLLRRFNFEGSSSSRNSCSSLPSSLFIPLTC